MRNRRKARDYLIFVHGVNTRKRREEQTYAHRLQQLLEERKGELDLRYLSLYWGNVPAREEQHLLRLFQADPAVWNALFFRAIRAQPLLQFTGDGALYISRFACRPIVDALCQQLGTALYCQADPCQDEGPERDRVHLVTHSFGTVILFDLLFSDRWNISQPPDSHPSLYPGVQAIRKHLFGLPPEPQVGLELCSIHTMGSPLGLYSLMMELGLGDQEGCLPGEPTLPRTHDITPLLASLLSQLRYRPIPWNNYLHPGDPVAHPLTQVMQHLLGDAINGSLTMRDVVIATQGVRSVFPLVRDRVLGLFGEPGQAMSCGLGMHRFHSSYWSSPQVADRIVETVRQAAEQTIIKALHNLGYERESVSW